MSKEKEFRVTTELKGLRLDQALAHFLESRMQAIRLIQCGFVRIANTQQIKASYRVKLGDCIIVTQQEIKKENPLKPYNFPIPIIYEDSSVLIVNKPAGLVVHPSPGHDHKTLINALIHKLNPNIGSDPNRPGLLHRLDKEVSGLLILSKTHAAHIFLAQQFLKRKINRTYWALCYKPLRFEEGRVESYIKRHPVDRKKFISSPTEGKKAITLFKVLKKNELALIQCQLLTGRTHQIRIHSREISGGIVGDSVYSNSKNIKHIKNNELIKQIKNLNRIALHAVSLTFIHPETKKEMTFHSPFPDILQEELFLVRGSL